MEWSTGRDCGQCRIFRLFRSSSSGLGFDDLDAGVSSRRCRRRRRFGFDRIPSENARIVALKEEGACTFFSSFFPPCKSCTYSAAIEKQQKKEEKTIFKLDFYPRNLFSVDMKKNHDLVCPMPRRPSPASRPSGESPQSLKPCRRICTSEDAGFEILDIFIRKAGVGDASSFGCSPPYFCGSPPSRSGNPLIHDVQFIRQRSSTPLVACSGQQTPPTTRVSKSPPVRIEGFVTSGSDSRSVSALA